MAVELPYSDWITTASTKWVGRKLSIEMNSASGRMSVSNGFKTAVFDATLEWVIPVIWAQDLLAQLHAADYNNVYEFTCNTVGLTRVYVTGAPTYNERQTGLWVRVFCPVERRV